MALSKDDILNAISEMTVMDLVDLIKSIEDKFGVSAAAPVAVAVAVPFPLTPFFPCPTAKSNPSKNFLRSGSTLLGSCKKSRYRFSIKAGWELVIYEKSFMRMILSLKVYRII